MFYNFTDIYNLSVILHILNLIIGILSKFKTLIKS